MSVPSTADSPPLAFGLRWGIKRSFIQYVQRMPDGRGWVGYGAQPYSEDEILFAPETAGRRTNSEGQTEMFWTFRGEVRFSGHFGFLFVRVASPELILRDGTATVLVAAPDSGTESPEQLPLATLRLQRRPAPTGAEIWQGTDVRLTEAGVEFFGGVYPPGEDLEPLTVTLPGVACADPDPSKQ